MSNPPFARSGQRNRRYFIDALILRASRVLCDEGELLFVQSSMADLGVYGMLFTLRADSIPGSAALLAQRPVLVEYMRRLERETGGKEADESRPTRSEAQPSEVPVPERER